MAYAQWLIPSKTQGSGNDTVNVTAGTDNTGRSPRQTAMTFKAANCEDVVRQVIQAGKPEFVTIQSAKSVSKDGVPTLTIEGTSNSSKLTFSLASGGTLVLTLPDTYLANSLTTQNGAAIRATQAHRRSSPSRFSSPTFRAIWCCQKTAQLIVTDNAGHTATCVITQACC